MAIVKLGDLPSDDPAPTGAGNQEWGRQASTATTLNNTFAFGTPIRRSAGGTGMVVSAFRPAEFKWRVRATTLWSSPDAVWTRADWLICLTSGTPGGTLVAASDLDGVQHQYAMCPMHSALGWISSQCEIIYRLPGGASHFVGMYWGGSAYGFNQAYHHGEGEGQWLRLESQVLGEGRT